MTDRLLIMEQKVEEIGRDVKAVKQVLLGDPNDKPGIIIRLDRVEQRLRLRDWLLGMILAAVIHNLITTVL